MIYDFVIIFSFFTGIKLVFSQFQWQLLLEDIWDYLMCICFTIFLGLYFNIIFFFSYMLVLAYTFVWLSYLNKYFLVIFSQSIYEYLLPSSLKILSWFQCIRNPTSLLLKYYNHFYCLNVFYKRKEIRKLWNTKFLFFYFIVLIHLSYWVSSRKLS